RTGHSDGTAAPASVKVATGSAPKASKQPTISGTAKVGKVLKAANGTWSPAPTSYGYQWYANGKAISGATKSSLTLKSAQSGKKITVKVTARRTGHSSGSATSKATKAVAR
ncbi:Tat pathway signal protein, partial [Streptomyces sp. NPDC057697]